VGDRQRKSVKCFCRRGLDHFQFWLLAANLASSLLVAGCATHKPAQQPQPPTFPATSEAAIVELHALPQGPYERLEIVTVAAQIGEQLTSAIKAARDSAAQKGANALVVLQDTEFPQRVGKRRLWVRRITYLAIHRGG
jgi:outer membrane murein-binding lipoprotein Lpp